MHPQPTWLDVPVPADLLPLFAKELRAPFDLTVNHWDPEHLFITGEARRCTRVAVAWTMWEFSSPPAGAGSGHGDGPHDAGGSGFPLSLPAGRVSGLVPHCGGRHHIRENLKWFDMVLGYDQVSAGALAPFTPEKTALGVLQGGYESGLWKPAERDWHGEKFVFLMHGAISARKAPWTVLEAFNELKIEKPEEFAGARLAVHTNAPGDIFPELNQVFAGKGMKFFIESFSKAELDAFYAAGHCLLAPSRGEGKNLPALEFMTTGGCVAATNYAGHTQWMNEDYAYPLDYDLTPSFEQHPWGAHDAKVSVDHLKDTIWHIFTHRDEARRKAELAQRLIPQMCDWGVVLENLFRRIRDEVPGPGQAVYDLAMASREAKAEERLPGPAELLR